MRRKLVTIALGLLLLAALLAGLRRHPAQDQPARRTVTRRRVSIKGISTPAMEVSGPPEQRPVLMFAGFLANMEAPRAAKEEFVRLLARVRERPVIALTLPWVSSPGPVPEGPLPPRLMEWAQAAVDTYRPAEIWGHSLGGQLLLGLLEHGDIRGARTIATSPAGICMPPSLRALRWVKGRAAPRLLEMKPRRRRWIVMAATRWTALPAEEVERMLDRMEDDPELAAWWARVGGEVLDWLRESELALAKDPGPAPDVMVFADRDPLVPRRAVAIACERWPETQIIVLPGSEHAVYEKPLVSLILDAVVRLDQTGSDGPHTRGGEGPSQTRRRLRRRGSLADHAAPVTNH